MTPFWQLEWLQGREHIKGAGMVMVGRKLNVSERDTVLRTLIQEVTFGFGDGSY